MKDEIIEILEEDLDEITEVIEDTQYVYPKEEDPTVPEYVKNITEENIENWNNKSEFSGSYDDLKNKPSINNQELSGNKSLEDLGIQPKGDYAEKSEIPTLISQLTNDSNFISEIPEEYKTKEENDNLYQPKGSYLENESDPTVPEFVKSITEEDITSWNNKQEPLTAGANITIEGNVISAAGGGGGGSAETISLDKFPNGGTLDLTGLKKGFYLCGFVNQSPYVLKWNESEYRLTEGPLFIILVQEMAEDVYEENQVLGYIVSVKSNGDGALIYTKMEKGYFENQIYFNDTDTLGGPQTPKMLTNYDQTFGGVKTFAWLPEASDAPTKDNQLTNKAYVDSSIATAITGALGGDY